MFDLLMLTNLPRAIEISVQTLIIFVGGAAFRVTRIGGKEWGISLALGFVSIPLGALIRFVPNPPIEKLFKKIRLLRDPDLLPSYRPYVKRNNVLSDKLFPSPHTRGARLRGLLRVDDDRKGLHEHDLSTISYFVPVKEQRPARTSIEAARPAARSTCEVSA